ncbi:hypothetical protein CPB84DRAFT_1129971 [Gymnopilus junonius]|uniref:Uncharacterized protein n=1 Tax=Gymnopilus junonius TaxID=109634 RepID=A0A9P5NPK8_GYMJU|nr:hypothetical protein CPB84DRAFT_1129971 [Gymnopilus junonius]
MNAINDLLLDIPSPVVPKIAYCYPKVILRLMTMSFDCHRSLHIAEPPYYESYFFDGHLEQKELPMSGVNPLMLSLKSKRVCGFLRLNRKLDMKVFKSINISVTCRLWPFYPILFGGVQRKPHPFICQFWQRVFFATFLLRFCNIFVEVDPKPSFKPQFTCRPVCSFSRPI